MGSIGKTTGSACSRARERPRPSNDARSRLAHRTDGECVRLWSCAITSMCNGGNAGTKFKRRDEMAAVYSVWAKEAAFGDLATRTAYSHASGNRKKKMGAGLLRFPRFLVRWPTVRPKRKRWRRSKHSFFAHSRTRLSTARKHRSLATCLPARPEYLGRSNGESRPCRRLRSGWWIKRQDGSHKALARDGWMGRFYFCFSRW